MYLFTMLLLIADFYQDGEQYLPYNRWYNARSFDLLLHVTATMSREKCPSTGRCAMNLCLAHNW